jgi:Glycosyl hydrolase catalytic core
MWTPGRRAGLLIITNTMRNDSPRRIPEVDSRFLPWFLPRLGIGLVAAALLATCAADPPASSPPATGSSPPDGSAAATPATPATPAPTLDATISLSLSTATRTPMVATALGLNYWSWTYGVTLAGTEAAVTALAPAILRIGGHNNDWNGPTPFSNDELDRSVAYARSVGAEPIIQVPILDDVNGVTPTADTAAAMVRYANVTKAYGVKYFSVGNEPDIYSDADQTPRVPNFTADSYCQIALAFVPAMRAVDPTIMVLGPELSWKYQDGANDWLTPILQGCGAMFDIVSIHRYPVDPSQTLRPAAAADAANFHATIQAVRAKMTAAGQGAKPLALTETNLTWNGDPTTSTLEASPGTLPAGLWAADALGTALGAGLWTTAFWSIRESWTLGMLTPDNVARPAYQAVDLFTRHFGPTLLPVTSSSSGVHAYASRSATDDATLLVIVNWTDNPQRLSIAATGGTGPAAPPAVVTVAPVTMTAVSIGDTGALTSWSYGQAEWQAHAAPSQSP